MSDELKFHRRVDELICGWSMLHTKDFKEDELNSLVDLLADDFKSQTVKIHANGVRVGKELNNIETKKLYFKLEKAVEALEWYANVDNYNSECAPCRDKPSDENGGFPNEYDEGERARECLKLIQGAGE